MNLDIILKKSKEWLKDPYNLTFIFLFIIIICIRFYYFWITKNQPLWWDEAEYMSAAKGFAGIVDYKISATRLPGFPLLVSVFYILNITSEPVIRFFMAFIPSLIMIALTYFMISSMYKDKKIALISTAIIGVLWESMFYSNRLHTENLALIFQYLAIIVLFTGYVKKKDFLFIKYKYSLFWIFLFCIISIFFRSGNIFYFPAIVLFYIYINRASIFQKKYYPYIFLSVLILIGVLIFLFNFPYAKTGFFSSLQTQNPLSWNNLTVFYGFYQSVVPNIPSVFFYFFIFGIILGFLELYYSLSIIKDKNHPDYQKMDSDIFNLLLLFSVMFCFVFLLRSSSFEFRWFFPLLPGMLVFTSKGVITFSKYICSFINLKNITIILILFFCVLGLYNQLVHADQIIKVKITSYQQVKDSGLWLKEHTVPGDIIISSSLTQEIFYSERKVENFYVNGSNQNESAFNEKVIELKPKYLVISAFEPGFTPQWAYDWPQRHSDVVEPVIAYYLDPQKKQLALVVYEFNQNNLTNLNQIVQNTSEKNIENNSMNKTSNLK